MGAGKFGAVDWSPYGIANNFRAKPAISYLPHRGTYEFLLHLKQVCHYIRPHF